VVLCVPWAEQWPFRITLVVVKFAQFHTPHSSWPSVPWINTLIQRFSQGTDLFFPYAELSCVVALRTETGFPTWLVSVPVFLIWLVVHQMPVGVCSVTWERLANLLLAFCAVLFTEWFLWEAIQKAKQNSKLGKGQDRAGLGLFSHTLCRLCFQRFSWRLNSLGTVCPYTLTIFLAY
jgi:hypothetical protein